MRGALRRPSRGRRAGLSFKACLSFLQAFLDKVLDSEVLVLSPSIILPRRAAHSAGPTPKMHPWRPFGASWLKKWCSKRLSKNDQILIPFRYWILTLSAPFWDAKMAAKSIQNRSKLGSRPILVSASFFTSIFDRFCIRKWTCRIYRIELPLQREHDFSKIGFPSRHRFLVRFSSQLGSTLASEIEDFSEFLGFQDAFKIASFFASIFYRFWLRFDFQLGAILEPKTPQNPKKMLPKIIVLLPKSGSEYDLP